jgi:NAD(P)-dependent dehydrogenase (short-subunit alcohol dehydrogenase family)
MTTVLITGCSSGYGLATAHRFLHEGWNVVATMRTPREDVLPRSDRVHLVALDVTSPDSIADAIESAGQIDVLVNNAGIGAVGVFEANPMEVSRELFETNTFGVMAMTQAVVPQMRARRSGVIVNVTSSVTLAAMPPGRGVHRQQDGHRRFHGLACTRARLLRRAGQARGTGIRPVNGVRQNGSGRMAGMFPPEYQQFAEPIMDSFGQPGAVTTPQDVADVVYHAATDTSEQLRFPAGADAVALAKAK